jgi:hypothetical protein
MSSNVNFLDYCQNPQLYKDDLTNTQLNFYNELCQAKQGLLDELPQIKDDLLKGLEDLGKGLKKEGEFALNLSGKIIEKLFEMISALFTPEGIKMFAYFYGVNFSIGIISNAFKTYLKDIATGSISKISEYILEKGLIKTVTSKLFNNLVISKTFFETIDRGLGRVFFEIVSFLPTFIPELLAAAETGVGIIMIISMVIDIWDPCGLNDQIGGSVLNKFTDNFNTAFRESVLKDYGSISVGDDKYIYLYDWPIEYLYDFNSLGDILTKDEYKYYSDLKIKYQLEYLANLRYNSYGIEINWNDPPGEIEDKITLSDVNKIESFVSNQMANDNTVLGNLFYKLLPLIILLIIFIIILIFIIIK